jgi:hypothetical protein
MTYKTAIRKQTHAIEYLQKHYAKPRCAILISGQTIRQITAWAHDPIIDSLQMVTKVFRQMHEFS